MIGHSLTSLNNPLSTELLLQRTDIVGAISYSHWHDFN